MNRGITLLLLLLFIQSYGQDIFTTDWMLTDLYIDGVIYNPPSNSEVPYVVASFTIDNPDFFESYINDPFSYSISIIDGGSTYPDGLALSITNSNGD